jgi:hypothetical protein
LHHELADDPRLATRPEEHGLAFTLGRTRGRKASHRSRRQLRQCWVAGRQHIVDLQKLGADPHHATALERLEHAHLGDLNHVCHLGRLQASQLAEDRLAVRARNVHTIQHQNMEGFR